MGTQTTNPETVSGEWFIYQRSVEPPATATEAQFSWYVQPDGRFRGVSSCQRDLPVPGAPGPALRAEPPRTGELSPQELEELSSFLTADLADAYRADALNGVVPEDRVHLGP